MARRFPDNALYQAVYTFGFPLLRAFFGVRVSGEGRFPEKGGVIVAVNHCANYDPVFAGLACPRQLAFLAKAELFRNPLLARLLRHLGSIPLHRGSADTGALRAAVEALESGKPLLLFPEGTRSRTGRLQQGRRGVGMLAARTGCPIQPVHLSGTFQLLRHFPLRRVEIRFGEPFTVPASPPRGMSVKEWHRRIGEDTMTRIKELQDGRHS
ncbi:MAG: lysophospholipid acyltransferase family protein [bacterium]|nr:lysophospholipid acyltransferase family protein [bacterium]